MIPARRFCEICKISDSLLMSDKKKIEFDPSRRQGPDESAMVQTDEFLTTPATESVPAEDLSACDQKQHQYVSIQLHRFAVEC
jgi:hypothetical protein